MRKDTTLGDRTLDQLPCLRASSTIDEPFAIGRLTALATRDFAPPVCFCRCWRLCEHLLGATALERWILRVMAMPEVEPAGLGDLRTAVALQSCRPSEATIAQDISRALLRRPGSRFFTGRDAFEKSALPFVQGRPPLHGVQPTPRSHVLHRAERVTLGPGQPSMAKSAITERPRPPAVTQHAYDWEGFRLVAADDLSFSWGESGEYPRRWGARGEDRLHKAART